MCGILFACCLCSPASSRSTSKSCTIPSDDQILDQDCFTQNLYETWRSDDLISRRGPDVSRVQMIDLSTVAEGLLMRGCVLHLRGKPTPQPVIDNDENILLWNGEIFDGINVARDENDTQVLSSLLSECLSEEDILTLLQKIHGPWSLIYWQAETKTLWFGRDMYGRRSLLWHLPSSKSHSFILSSVAVGELEFTEVPSVGIFSMNFSKLPSGDGEKSDNLIQMTIHPWLQSRWPESTDLVIETDPKDLPTILKYSPYHVSISTSEKQILQSWIPPVNPSLPPEDVPKFPLDSSTIDERDLVRILETILKENEDFRCLSEKLVTSLLKAVEKRLNNLPAHQSSALNNKGSRVPSARLAILFSGGLDSSILAALADRCLPLDEPIDLLNVAFEQPAPVSLNAKQMQKHKSKRARKNANNSKDFGQTASSEETITSEQTSATENRSHPVPNKSEETSSKLLHCSEGMKLNQNCDKSHQTPPCEALSFEKDFSNMSASDIVPSENIGAFNPFDVPDRKTGRMAYSELCNMNPRRQWNFIEINVTQEELKSQRQSQIRKLIYPLCTVLDDSIGCALWFAARGKGTLVVEGQEHDVVSKAKVILCGMAADEQFAGYSRHRAHFNKFGWEGLISQLQQEMWRISQRNLGRDDRIISDHGKEARFPFLDECFTKFVSEIPVYMRADLKLPRGVGEKLLLRMSAFSLGFRSTAIQAKRAIQFGSKIAKLDKTNEKGSDVCERLL